MKTPIEYGDNFPVLSNRGLWDPRAPWSFPKHRVRVEPTMLQQILPWVMLAVGMAGGILWMSWRLPMLQPVHQMEATTETAVQRGAGERISPAPSAHPKYPMEGMPKRSLGRQKTGLA